ncbi:MAG: glycoside hydrolase family 95 protein [Chloroflexi bacterium]|nr:glycoside hydrolase family 95 protein [Chloroflexota bacterium]
MEEAVEETNPTKLWYDRPAQEWVEALPIGNGRLGAMVFGGPAAERLQLNEDTLWSGGPREWDNPQARQLLPEVREAIRARQYTKAEELCKGMQGPFNQSYLPLGDLHVEMDHGGEVSDYYRELDLDRAVATARYRVGEVTYTREALASHPVEAIVLRLTADQAGKIGCTVRLDSPLRSATKATAGELALTGRAPAHVDPSYYPSDNPVVYEDEGGEGMAFAAVLRVAAEGGMTFAEGDRLRVVGANALTLTLAARTSYGGYQVSPGREGPKPLPRVHADLARADKPYPRLLEEHLFDHQSLFRRVSLDLGTTPAAALPTDRRIRDYAQGDDPQLVALLFRYGRYLLIASSRPGSQPANLQGIWNDQVRPPWSSNWTLNINTEMNYWPAETCALSELHEPLFDLIAGLAANGARTARVNYGCRGWTVHHNADLWRQSAPAGAYGWGRPQWAMWPLAGAWLCQHLWEHYAFGGDLDDLRERAWPLMRGAAQFCLDWLVDDGEGHLVTMPSTSPENTFRTAPDAEPLSVSAATTMDMALIWDLFTNCVAAARALDVDDAFRERLEQALDRLLPPRIGRHGQLQEWSEDWDDPDDHHRHVSHLFGVYPGRQITPRQEKLWRAAQRSLELRGDGGTGWSMGWKINLWARFGEGDRAHRMLRNLLTPAQGSEVRLQGGGTYPNLFDAHPPFQIDGNLGATAGIAEMLLQSHAGEIHLLPALPSAWPAGRVRGLRARGGFVVDIAWAEGKLVEARIHSRLGRRCRVRYGDETTTLATRRGQSYTLTPPLGKEE